MDGKLNLILGIKAEQFSLVSDKPYFSPQAKFTFIPVESLTFWGGFSRAYTTPGFNQTNIELALFKAPSYEALYPVIGAQVENGVYQGTFASMLFSDGKRKWKPNPTTNRPTAIDIINFSFSSFILNALYYLKLLS